ncbi:MAG: hypothetical protein EP343_05270 [Deltaproteobacteria bacterium]|nr:MAG: hypothetical protein EP343_05270 [Deltaproteobacteria bacterium]
MKSGTLLFRRISSLHGTMALLLILPVLLLGCPTDPITPDGPGLPDKVAILSPADKAVLNASNDADPSTPGIQVAVEIEITPDKSGKLPGKLKAWILVNNKIATEKVDVGATKVKFDSVTLEETTNNVQAVLELTADDNSVKNLNSTSIQVTADSKCYQIQVSKPTNGGTLGAAQDADPQTPGFQTDIEVSVDPQALEEITLVITPEGGQAQTLKATPAGGKATFQATLQSGSNTLEASITDPAGNSCSDSIKVNVADKGPTVSISAPTAGQQLCPKDDADAQTQGFQVNVEVTTDAEDGSTASLFEGDTQVGADTVVSGGKATFAVTLPEQSAVSKTYIAKVKDKLGNEGQSSAQSFDVSQEGYTLTFVGLLENQIIPFSRDEDKNTPGLQLTIQLTTSAPDGTSISLDLDGTAQPALTSNGAVAKGQITLKEGKNCLKASVTEPKCSVPTEVNICITVEQAGVPSLECSLANGPAFDSTTNTASINATNDTDTQTNGVQNGLSCKTDAEKDQDLELSINGNAQTQKLADGQNNLREASFSGLTIQEGANTLIVKVTNQAGKTKQVTYTVNLDSTPPSAIADLAGSVTDHRKASVTLTWTAPQDGTGSGASEYEIRWSSELTAITESEWAKPEGKQTVTSNKKAGEQVSALVDKLSVGKTYIFAVRAKDGGGNLSSISNVFKVSIDFKSTQSSESGSGKTSYGFSVTGVGDLDKDGLQDVVVCAPAYASGGKARLGAAFIYYGRNVSQGGYFNTTPDVTITGTNASDAFCQQVEPVGDINGDGFSDFAVRSFFAESVKGRVWIFFGGARGTTIKNGTANSLARVTITGQSGLFFGIYMTSVGRLGRPDLNGDNKVDLVIGSLNAAETGSTFKGKLYAYFSRTSYPAAGQPALALTLADADLEIVNDVVAGANPLFGGIIASGDINRDKNADLFISSTGDSSVLGLLGPIKATSGKKLFLSNFTTKFSIKGKASSTFGSAISIVGDVDKDGSNDVLISALTEQIGGVAAGRTRLFSGKILTAGSSLTEANSAVAWDGSGAFLDKVSGAGDVNGDGFADFVIGEGAATDPNNTTNTRAGAVYLFFGKALNQLKGGKPQTAADVIWYGSKADAGLGQNGLRGGRDLTGDGFPDILMVETPPTKTSNLGIVYLQY